MAEATCFQSTLNLTERETWKRGSIGRCRFLFSELFCFVLLPSLSTWLPLSPLLSLFFSPALCLSSPLHRHNLLFSLDQIEERIPPKPKRQHQWHVLVTSSTLDHYLRRGRHQWHQKPSKRKVFIPKTWLFLGVKTGFLVVSGCLRLSWILSFGLAALKHHNLWGLDEVVHQLHTRAWRPPNC